MSEKLFVASEIEEIRAFVKRLSQMAELLSKHETVPDMLGWIVDMALFYERLPQKSIRISEGEGINIFDGMDTLFNIIRHVSLDEELIEKIFHGFGGIIITW